MSTDEANALIEAFETAAIAYREYMCGETGKEYDAYRAALFNALTE